MNANYSDALEQQVALLQWSESAGGQRFCKTIFGGQGPGQTVTGLLRYADSFFVSADISRFVSAAAAAVPQMHPTVEALHPWGGVSFAWFEKAIALPRVITKGGESFNHELVAMSWGAVSRHGEERPDRIFVVPWIRSPTMSPRIIPWSVYEWLHEETQHDAAKRERNAREPVVDQQNGVVFDPVKSTELLFSILGSFALFVDQRVFVSSQRELERHARKRVERSGWQYEPLVRVVELRRREHIGNRQTVQPTEREWSCQWVVRGHWRQQPYPKAGDIRPLWITPYVKGPDDKPLKPPRATVFAVVR